MGLVFNRSTNIPLYKQLYEQIIEGIEQQRLIYGARLPSKRKLSQHLNLSLNTVESAYAQLQAEGYIESKARSGFFVSFIPTIPFQTSAQQIYQSKERLTDELRFDFNPNVVDSTLFPFNTWRKIQRTVFNSEYSKCVNLGEKQGELVLRQQIANYLYTSRGVRCQPQQVIIEAGVESCLTKLTLMFDQFSADNFTYAMEEFGYPNVELLLNALKKRLIKLPLNKEHGALEVETLYKQDVNTLYITPSHQFPFGESIDISKRHRLIEWARESEHRFIIEDDYDSEFRYKGNPIPALQQLDSEKVIYLGSFSKLLSPSMRITFMVLPESLSTLYKESCGFFNPTVPRFEQHVLANFIEQGELQRHINRMRKVYRNKMELICKLLQPHHDHVLYYGEQCGFYLLLELINDDRSLNQLVECVNDTGTTIYPIKDKHRKLITLGFANLSLSDIEEGVNLLLKAWNYKQ